MTKNVITLFNKTIFNKTIKTRAALLSLIFLAFTSLATEYDVDKSQKNLVKFISDAKFESFEGVTDKIDGYLVHEGEDILSNNQLYFEVDLRTLDTGIGLRNRHMRDDYLETDRYPMSSFKGKIAKADKVSEGQYKVTASGNMTIHGVTRPLTLNGILYKVNNGYRIKSNFDIKLPDYKIEIPQLMFFKISEIIKLDLDFYTKLIKK